MTKSLTGNVISDLVANDLIVSWRWKRLINGMVHSQVEDVNIPTNSILSTNETDFVKLCCNRFLVAPQTGFTIRSADKTKTGQWNICTWNILCPASDAKEYVNRINIFRNLTYIKRPKSLLVFINPYGGNKRAESIFYNAVQPIFGIAGVSSTVVLTTHKGHCRNYVMSEDLHTYDGAVAVGGDGLFSELLHGLLERTRIDANHDVDADHSPFSPEIQPNLRIGLIPAGPHEYVWVEYLLEMAPEKVRSVYGDTRVKAASLKTGCKLEVTKRVLNRLISPSTWARLPILRITGPDDQSIAQFNKLLETWIPDYANRKEYPRRAPVCFLSRSLGQPAYRNLRNIPVENLHPITSKDNSDAVPIGGYLTEELRLCKDTELGHRGDVAATSKKKREDGRRSRSPQRGADDNKIPRPRPKPKPRRQNRTHDDNSALFNTPPKDLGAFQAKVTPTHRGKGGARNQHDDEDTLSRGREPKSEPSSIARHLEPHAQPRLRYHTPKYNVIGGKSTPTHDIPETKKSASRTRTSPNPKSLATTGGHVGYLDSAPVGLKEDTVRLGTSRVEGPLRTAQSTPRGISPKDGSHGRGSPTDYLNAFKLGGRERGVANPIGSNSTAGSGFAKATPTPAARGPPPGTAVAVELDNNGGPGEPINYLSAIGMEQREPSDKQLGGFLSGGVGVISDPEPGAKKSSPGDAASGTPNDGMGVDTNPLQKTFGGLELDRGGSVGVGHTSAGIRGEEELQRKNESSESVAQSFSGRKANHDKGGGMVVDTNALKKTYSQPLGDPKPDRGGSGGVGHSSVGIRGKEELRRKNVISESVAQSFSGKAANHDKGGVMAVDTNALKKTYGLPLDGSNLDRGGHTPVGVGVKEELQRNSESLEYVEQSFPWSAANYDKDVGISVDTNGLKKTYIQPRGVLKPDRGISGGVAQTSVGIGGKEELQGNYESSGYMTQSFSSESVKGVLRQVKSKVDKMAVSAQPHKTTADPQDTKSNQVMLTVIHDSDPDGRSVTDGANIVEPVETAKSEAWTHPVVRPMSIDDDDKDRTRTLTEAAVLPTPPLPDEISVDRDKYALPSPPPEPGHGNLGSVGVSGSIPGNVNAPEGHSRDFHNEPCDETAMSSISDSIQIAIPAPVENTVDCVVEGLMSPIPRISMSTASMSVQLKSRIDGGRIQPWQFVLEASFGVVKHRLSQRKHNSLPASATSSPPVLAASPVEPEKAQHIRSWEFKLGRTRSTGASPLRVDVAVDLSDKKYTAAVSPAADPPIERPESPSNNNNDKWTSGNVSTVVSVDLSDFVAQINSHNAAEVADNDETAPVSITLITELLEEGCGTSTLDSFYRAAATNNQGLWSSDVCGKTLPDSSVSSSPSSTCNSTNTRRISSIKSETFY